MIATKFLIKGVLSGAQIRSEIRARLDASLTRLAADHVELYYQHRVPSSIPVEDVAAITRFQTDNVRANQPLLDLLAEIAQENGATPAQIPLAWMLRKKNFIVPIPGMRKLERIEENLGSADLEFTGAEFARIESALAKIEIHGNRTDEDITRLRSMR